MKKPVVIMNHSENSGVSYYRMWMQSKYLARAGWDVRSFPDVLPVMSIEEWEKMLEGADLFVTQKSDNPQLLALFMAARDIYNIPVVFEIDDDIYDVASNSPAYQYFYPGSPFIEMTEMVMQNVDAMTVSTQKLADKYREHCKDIYVLGNCQDISDWEGAVAIEGRRQDQLVIGWAGSATHYDDLKLIWQPMKKVLRNNPNVVFRVLGCLPDFMADHPQVELRSDWAPIRQWQAKLKSMQFDIGLCPVTGRDFNAGKSNIKWQEYGILGIPTVASNFGPYKEIRSGEDGYLASNDSEWVYYIEKLIKDAADRKRIGEAAKRRVLTDFNIEENIVKWERAYCDIIDRFKSVSR